jgi:hypothetical protein
MDIEVRVSESPCCDFCSSTEPRYLEDARTFTATEIEGVYYTRSEGAWAACVRCHRLIQARNWDRLERRAIQQLLRKHPGIPRDIVAAGVHTEHVRFRAHQT